MINTHNQNMNITEISMMIQANREPIKLSRVFDKFKEVFRLLYSYF